MSSKKSQKNIIFSDQEYNHLVKQIETYAKTDSGKKVLKDIEKIRSDLESSLKSLEKDILDLTKN
jgi:hypothetical protein